MTASAREPMLNKVPEIFLSFWIIKILATTIGETGADFLAFRMGLGLGGTSLVMGAALLVVLAVQLRLHRYVPVVYWLTVVLLSIVGTLVTDNLTDSLGVSLFVSSGVFAALLAATFAAWFASERILSIHTIVTRRRELFYWSAILFTFALGTAAGDLVAERLAWGYGLSAVIFGSLIAAATASWYLFRVNVVLVFWIAYILTRPFGASIGDLLSQPTTAGGLGFGAAHVSEVFAVGIVGLVIFLTLRARATLIPAPADRGPPATP